MDPHSDEQRRRNELFASSTDRALAFAEAGDRDAAWREIEDACSCGAEVPFPEPLQLAIEQWISEDPSGLQRLERLVEEYPRCAAPMWSLAIVLDFQGETGRARQLLRENWAWAWRLRPPGRMAMWEHVDLQRALDSDDAQPSVRYQALLSSGRLRDAERLAPALMRPLLQQAAGLADRRQGQATPFRGDGELVASGPERPNGTVVLFTGLRDQAWAPMHVLDLFFAELGLRALYLRDFRRLAFLDGLASLGGSLAETIAALGDKVAGHGPVYTMGNSAGGLAALVYAQQLGAKRTLVFSPPTTMDPVLTDRLGDRRARLWHRRFLSLVDHRPFDAPAIAAGMPSGFRMTVYAGAESREDRAHAERLVGQPRVQVNLLEGVDGHNSLAYVAARHDLVQVFRDAFLA